MALLLLIDIGSASSVCLWRRRGLKHHSKGGEWHLHAAHAQAGPCLTAHGRAWLCTDSPGRAQPWPTTPVLSAPPTNYDNDTSFHAEGRTDRESMAKVTTIVVC